MRFLILCAGLLPLIAQDDAKPAQDPPATQEAKPAAEQEAKPEEKAAAPAAAAPAPSDRTVSGSIDLGYRFVHTAGSYDAYRSIVDLGEGPKVLNFDFSLVNPNGKWYDKVTLLGMGWGGDPNETTRLDATKQRLYDFHFDYRNIAYYNFLPSFANPLIDQNIYATQQGYDIRRRMIDTELRFRPGTRISPYLAYSSNWGAGRGVSTFAQDASNQYPVFNGLSDRTQQFRGGVILEFSKFSVTLEEGGTTFKDDQTLSNSNKLLGDRTTPYFGQTLYLTNLLQAYRIRGDSIFSRAILTYTPFSWLDFNGSFLYSRPETDVKYTQNNTGTFVNLSTLQFYNTQTEFANGNATMPHSTGNMNLELRPFRHVRILESWMTDRYDTTSLIAISNLTNLNPQAISTPGSDRLIVNYNQQQVQANVDLLSWLTVRGGWRYVWGDAQVRAPIENGVPTQNGELKQQVALFGTQLRFGQKFWINGDAEIATADHVYFRTSLADYQKGTVRARYQLVNSFALTGNFYALTNHSPNSAWQFDLTSYTESLGFIWNPQAGKRITVLGDYTHSSLSTNTTYYTPQDLQPALSAYHENAHTGTVLVDVASPAKGKYAPKLSLGGAFFKSSGSRPTQFYTPILKLSVPVHERVQLFAEYRYYGMAETFYSYEGFRSNIFVAGLRLIR